MTTPTQDQKTPLPDDGLQGEGNVAAARRYDKATAAFVQSGRVDEAARDAAPDSPQEAEDMARAEDEGKRHAKQ